MEENKNAFENEGNEINEEELAEVAGGDADAMSAYNVCWFEPEHPVQHTKANNGVIYVKCKSRCGPICECNNTSRCRDRWHITENVAGNIWAPSPVEKYNHKGANKAIISSDIK